MRHRYASELGLHVEVVRLIIATPCVTVALSVSVSFHRGEYNVHISSAGSFHFRPSLGRISTLNVYHVFTVAKIPALFVRNLQDSRARGTYGTTRHTLFTPLGKAISKTADVNRRRVPRDVSMKIQFPTNAGRRPGPSHRSPHVERQPLPRGLVSWGTSPRRAAARRRFCFARFLKI